MCDTEDKWFFFHNVETVNDKLFQNEDSKWRKCTIIAKNWHYYRHRYANSLKFPLKKMF